MRGRATSEASRRGGTYSGTRPWPSGESVHAVVVPKPATEANAEGLVSHCRGRLAGYKCPRNVAFAEALPRDPVGKTQKKVLREQYARTHNAEANAR